MQISPQLVGNTVSRPFKPVTRHQPMSKPAKPAVGQPRFGENFLGPIEAFISLIFLTALGVPILAIGGAAVKAVADKISRSGEKSVNPELYATTTQLKQMMSDNKVVIEKAEMPKPNEAKATVTIGDSRYDVTIANLSEERFGFQPVMHAKRDDGRIEMSYEVSYEQYQGRKEFSGPHNFAYIDNSPVMDAEGKGKKKARPDIKGTMDSRVTEPALGFVKALWDQITAQAKPATQEPQQPVENPFDTKPPLDI